MGEWKEMKRAPIYFPNRLLNLSSFSSVFFFIAGISCVFKAQEKATKQLVALKKIVLTQANQDGVSKHTCRV